MVGLKLLGQSIQEIKVGFIIESWWDWNKIQHYFQDTEKYVYNRIMVGLKPDLSEKIAWIKIGL